jgi:hypothetical protein
MRRAVTLKQVNLGCTQVNQETQRQTVTLGPARISIPTGSRSQIRFELGLRAHQTRRSTVAVAGRLKLHQTHPGAKNGADFQ